MMTSAKLGANFHKIKAMTKAADWYVQQNIKPSSNFEQNGLLFKIGTKR